MLRPRFLTAIIGIPLGLAVIYLGGWYLAAVVAVIAVVGLQEFYRLLRVNDSVPVWTGRLLAVYIILGAAVSPSTYESVWLGVGALLLTMCLGHVALRQQSLALYRDLGDAFRQFAAVMLGVAYVPLLIGYMLLIRALSSGPVLGLGVLTGAGWLALVVGATWVMDIAAYAVGKAVGRHKLAPRISPGKTVEGAVGALLGAVAVSWGLGTWLGLSASQAVLLGLLLGIGGQLGDLFESWLKRRARVKDSGTLLPGHGGVLDRFDSLLFNAPIAYYFLRAVL